MYSNSCCSCSFEAEILKIGQSSHKMYSNNIVIFQESTTILNACTKKSGNLLNAPCIISYMYKKDLALNNLQWLIGHKTQPNLNTHTHTHIFICIDTHTLVDR